MTQLRQPSEETYPDFDAWMKGTDIGFAQGEDAVPDFTAWMKGTDVGFDPKLTVGRLASQAGRAGAQGIADIARSMQAAEERRDIAAEQRVDAPDQPIDDPFGFTRRRVTELGPRERFEIREAARKAEADTGAALTPEARKAIQMGYLSKRQQERVGNLQSFIDLMPEPLEGSSGIVEDAVKGMARFLPAMGLSAVNPVAGTAMTFAQIMGMKYDEYRKAGVDKERAFESAAMSAAAQTPVEMAGNLLQVGIIKNLAKSFKVGGPKVQRVTDFLWGGVRASGAEAGEEYVQQWMDEAANIYAANPDMDLDELASEYVSRIPETAKAAKESAKIGAVGGGLLFGAAGVIQAPFTLEAYRRDRKKQPPPGMGKDAPMPTPESGAKDLAQARVRVEKAQGARPEAPGEAQGTPGVGGQESGVGGQEAVPSLDQVLSTPPDQPLIRTEVPEVPGLTEAQRAGAEVVDADELAAQAELERILAEEAEGPEVGGLRDEQGPVGADQGAMPGGPASAMGGAAPAEAQVVAPVVEPAAAAPVEEVVGDGAGEEGVRQKDGGQAGSREQGVKELWEMTSDEYRKKRAEITGRAPKGWKEDYKAVIRNAVETGKDVPKDKALEVGINVMEPGDLLNEDPTEQRIAAIPPKNQYDPAVQNPLVRLRAPNGELYAIVSRPFSQDPAGGRFWKFKIHALPAVKTNEAKELQAALPKEEALIDRDGDPTGMWARATTPDAEKFYGPFIAKPEKAKATPPTPKSVRSVETLTGKRLKPGEPRSGAVYLEDKGPPAPRRVIRAESGKPFRTEQAAWNALKKEGLDDLDYDAVPVDGGVVLKEKAEKLTPAAKQVILEDREKARLRGLAGRAKSFRQWVKYAGGIRRTDPSFKGELRDAAKGKGGLPPFVFRKDGRGIDEMTQEAIEAGWLPPDSTEQDFIDALIDNRTDKVADMGNEEYVDKRWEEENNRLEALAEDLRREGCSEDEIAAAIRGGEAEEEAAVDARKDGRDEAVDEDGFDWSKGDFVEDPDEIREQQSLFGPAKQQRFDLTPEELTEKEKLARAQDEARRKGLQKKGPKPVFQHDKGIKPVEVGKQRGLFTNDDGQIELEFQPSETKESDAGPPAGPTPELRQRVSMSDTGGAVRAAGFVARTKDDIASLLSDFALKSQENLLYVTTDRDGNILEIHHYVKGTKSSAGVNLSESAGHILNVPGAHTTYYVHNHPSGDPTPSPEDIALGRGIKPILDLADVKLESMVLGRDTWHDIETGLQHPIKETDKKVSIPLKERGNLERMPTYTGRAMDPYTLQKYLKDTYRNREGFLLMNRKMQDIGFLPFQSGRTMKENTRDLYAAIEKSNASGLIFNSHTEVNANTTRGQYLTDLMYEMGGDPALYDIVDPRGALTQQGLYHSFREDPLHPGKLIANVGGVGIERAKGPRGLQFTEIGSTRSLFSRKRQDVARPPRGMTVTAVKKMVDGLHKAFPGLRAHEIVVLKNEGDLGADVAARAAEGREEPGDFYVRGLYDVGEDGKRTIYLFADGMDRRQDVVEVFVHEAFHDGVSTGLGNTARQVFLNIYRDHQDAIRPMAESRGLDLTTDAGRAEATEEWIVDGMVQDTLPQTVWERIIRAVKDMLRKAGVRLEYTRPELGLRRAYQDADVRQVIRDAVVGARNAERGARSVKGAGARREVPAWHGGPHAFDRFDTDFIGTGEGSQMFGWGLYFTDLEEIARRYAGNGADVLEVGKAKVKISNRSDLWDKLKDILDAKTKSVKTRKRNELIRDLADHIQYLDETIETFKGDLERHRKAKYQPGIVIARDNLDRYKNHRERTLEVLNELESGAEIKASRNLYKVTLHKGKKPSQYSWMNWDKPLSKDLAEKVRAQLTKEGVDYSDTSLRMTLGRRPMTLTDYANRYNMYPELVKDMYAAYMKTFDAQLKEVDTAGHFYQDLSAVLGSDKEASLFLLRAGIDGIRYPSGTLMGRPKGAQDAYNYVVFDPDAVTIEAHTRWQLAGRKAAGAPTGKLAEAERMLAEGKSEQEVWDKTGWTKEASGKWAFRIDDSGAKLTGKAKSESMQWGTLSEFLSHKELYSAYPQLKNVLTQIIIDPKGKETTGSFRGYQDRSAEDLFDIQPEIHVTAPTVDKAKAALLHEIAHAIQDIEGFASGGSPKNAYGMIREADRIPNTPEARNFWGDQKVEWASSIRQTSGMGSEQQRAQRLYEAMAGEIYAREAGSQFKGLPGTMEGIPRDQWIVKDGEGTSFSVESVKPWPKDFPKAYAHTTVGKVTNHPDFQAAKGGDVDAAMRLVKDLIKTDRLKALAEKYPDAIVVPVQEIEAGGKNMIPLAMARLLEKEGLRVSDEVLQGSTAKRKGLDAARRLLTRKAFEGPVEKGGQYILVDDVLTQGGTIHELRHYIANNGGDAVGVFSLAFSAGSNIIAIKDQTITDIKARFGRENIESLLQEYNVSGTIEALTESEGRTLLRFKTLDALRKRLSEEVHKGGLENPPREILGDLSPSVERPPAPRVRKEGKAVPPGVASLTGAQEERRSALARLRKDFKEFWRPFSTVPEGDKALAARYKGMGDAARAMRYIEQIHEKLDAFPDNVKKDLFMFMDGQIDVVSLPEEAREIAQRLKEKTTVIGQMLVDRGIISQAAFDEHKGHYVHYMYAYHILGDKMGSVTTSTGKLNLTYAKQRKDLTTEERKALGLIEDASIAVPVGMGKALTDIAKWDYMEVIAENDQWTWQPSLVEVPRWPKRPGQKATMKMGIGKLIEEVDKYREMLEKAPSEEIQKKYDILKAALDQAVDAAKNVPKDYTQLPTTKTYGPLAGAFVRTPIAKDLQPVMNLYTDKGKILETLARIEAQGMATFKMGKVALNFPTAFRNVISNILQNNMRGRPLAMIPADVVSACRSMLKKDAYYEEAFGHGIFRTNWFVTEINDVLDTFRKAEGGSLFKIISAIKSVARYYGKIDDISKHAIFVQMRKSGHSVDEAVLEAMKWGMDYSLASRSIKGLRLHFVPFISYQYKIAPLIAESLRKRPWVIGKYVAGIFGVEMLTRLMHDLDDDDWEELERQLPAYVKDAGSVMVLPWKTPEGQWQWVNVEYFLPWGNYLNLFRDMSKGDAGEVYKSIGISNPYLDIARMVASARGDRPPQHPFYGTPIYNQLDPAPMKAAKVVQFLAFTWLPSMLDPGRGAVGYTIDALEGKRDRWGKRVTPQQAVGRWFGVNMVAVSPAQTRAIASVKVQELRKELYRILNNPNKSEAEKAQAEKRYQEELAEIAETGASGAVLPIVKRKGKDPVYDTLVEMLRQGASLPGPPSRTFSMGGVQHKLTNEEYETYLMRASEMAVPRLERLFASSAWDTRPREWKEDRIRAIVSAARKRARGQIKRTIWRERRAANG